ncbi:hypothetical protein BG910_11020 [Neisseria chenwenguii]|uniref:Sel1 repeat family protein n=2 Tax=Neisseria chenwenguii TaxID=1853278 RepID=A0A220S3V0_9NEIS|nr:hypothetical protein BG910_11020 [Neisseria chenwenguii]
MIPMPSICCGGGWTVANSTDRSIPQEGNVNMKYKFSVFLVTALAVFPVHADTGKVFGSSGLHGSRQQARTAQTESGQRIWQRDQSYALDLYRQVQSGNASAVTELKKSANSGNRWAALQYGYLAHTGKLPGSGGKPDMSTAIKAYNLSAKRMDKGRLADINGNYMAAYNMGLVYYYGQGVAANGAEALRWFRAAESAYRAPGQHRVFWPATVYIAQILERGYGVAKNEKEALEYWERAAKANEAEGLYGYGMAILNGKGGVQNPYRAYPVLLNAANRWHVGAMVALAKYQGSGDKLREANPVDAAKWWTIAAMVNKRYSRQAEKAMTALPVAKQQQVRSQTRSWLSTHGTVPKSFDWKQPINTEIPQR